MQQMMKLLNIQWKGKHVIINEGKDDYTVGVWKKMDWVIDENVYDLPIRVKLTFEEGSDVPERIFEAETIEIKKDPRFKE